MFGARKPDPCAGRYELIRGFRALSLPNTLSQIEGIALSEAQTLVRLGRKPKGIASTADYFWIPPVSWQDWLTGHCHIYLIELVRKYRNCEC
jgi:hypothetical protein